MIYLASVYSLDATSKSAEHIAIREARYQDVMQKTAALLKAGHKVFSPIAHCHPMSVAHDMPATFDFWMELDCHYISKCDELWVYRMQGWERSNGITEEIRYAKSIGIPVLYID